jgi:hypothetical protein
MPAGGKTFYNIGPLDQFDLQLQGILKEEVSLYH